MRWHGLGGRARGVARSVVVAVAALVLSAAMALPALAAEPAPTSATGGDPRSPGEGPGLVGDPLFALGVVALVALLSVGLTLAYLRATDRTPGGRRG